MISATNGHDIKYSASEALKNEVDEWLAKGNKKVELKCFLDIQKDLKKSEKVESLNCYKKSRVRAKNKMVDDMRKRLEYQKPLLEDYRKRVGKHAFSILSKAVNGEVRASYLSQVANGYNSIADSDKWMKIKKEVKRILRELKV